MRTRPRTRSDFAVRIQAAFRGFIGRKYVRKVDAVRREVEEIGRRMIREEDTVEVMRSDERERLKASEALMSLLCRLDSVGGVDAGGSESRKEVTEEAIALQETVEAISMGADLDVQKEGGVAEVEQSEQGVVHYPDSPDQEEAEAEQIGEQVADLPDQEGGGCAAAQSEELVLDLPDQKKEGGVEAEQAYVLDQKVDCCEIEQSGDHFMDWPDQEEGGIVEQVDEGSCEGSDLVAGNTNDSCDLKMEMKPDVFEASGESQSDPSMNPVSFLEEVDENALAKEEEVEAGSLEEKAVEEEAVEKDSGHGKDNNRIEEMLGRMMEDNKKKMMEDKEKMMGMMMQMLSQLSQRVARLENAFLRKKLPRTKKRPAGFSDGLQDSNMYGKKS